MTYQLLNLTQLLRWKQADAKGPYSITSTADSCLNAFHRSTLQFGLPYHETLLEQLSLSGNRIGNAGLIALAASLRLFRPKLWTFDVSSNAFDDEGFGRRHDEAYLLSMAGTPPMRKHKEEEATHVPHRNGSQFFITTKATSAALGGSTIPHLDYRHVVFGRVVGPKSIGVVNRIQKLPVDAGRGHRLLTQVEITGCGELLQG